MRYGRFLVLLLSCTWLLACGGTSGDGGAPGDAGHGMEYVVRDAAFESLASRLEDAEPTVTLPLSGSATYAGFMGAVVTPAGQDTVFLTGKGEISARFAERTVAGRFDRFLGAGGATIPGEIVLVDGRIARAGISADVAGTIDVAGRSHAVSGNLSGTFLGPGADSVGGVVEAGLSAGGRPSGGFSAEVWLQR